MDDALRRERWGEFLVVIIGENNTGKTSLIKSFLADREVQSEALAVDTAYSFDVRVGGQQVSLSVLDTRYCEAMTAPRDLWRFRSHVAVLVYDVTERSSFEYLPEGQSMFMHGKWQCPRNPSELVVVATKTDVAEHRQVSTEEGEEYASNVAAAFFEVCTADSAAVKLVFEEVIQRCVYDVGFGSEAQAEGRCRKWAFVMCALESTQLPVEIIQLIVGSICWCRSIELQLLRDMNAARLARESARESARKRRCALS